MFKFPSFLRGGHVPTLPRQHAPDTAAAVGRRGKAHLTGAAPQSYPVQVTPTDRRAVFQAVSLLLGYPTDQWNTILEAVDTAAYALPETIGEQLRGFVRYAKDTGQAGVEQTYVATFDQKRRCCLELSYYATGDTRQRGIALTIFRDLYRAVGWDLQSTDLPDFLPNVLELAARCDDPADQELVDAVISSHREGVEILHSALAAIDSPWAQVVSALRQVLPVVDDDTSYRLQKLVRQGPPQELVGVAQATALPWPVAAPDDAQSPAGALPAADGTELSADPALAGYSSAVAAAVHATTRLTPKTTGAHTSTGDGADTRTRSRSAQPPRLHSRPSILTHE